MSVLADTVSIIGMHTMRSILKISSRQGLQRRGGARTLDDDGFDAKAMGKVTRFPESMLVSFHNRYIDVVGSAKRNMQMHHWQKFARQTGFRDQFIIKRMFETFDSCRNGLLTFVEVKSPCVYH